MGSQLIYLKIKFMSIVIKTQYIGAHQGAASLMIMAKSSFERHYNFNDVWHHHHQSLSMTTFVIIIVICRHRHFFFVFLCNYKPYWLPYILRWMNKSFVYLKSAYQVRYSPLRLFKLAKKIIKTKILRKFNIFSAGACRC